MKSLRNCLFFAVFAVGSFQVLANSLDEYAKNSVAKNLVANQVLLSCKGPELTVKSVIKDSKISVVTDKKVIVVTKLKNCHYTSILSSFLYKDDVTKIVSMSSAQD